jgi:copper chaperone CopZ
MNAYLQHVIDGRLRVKVPEIKRAPLKATEVVQALQRVRGVRHVQTNPTTGSVLVLFESHVIGPEQLVLTLQSIGCLVQSGPPEPAPSHWKGVGQKFAEALVQSVFELAVQRAVLALI